MITAFEILELPADIVLTPDDHWVQCDSCCKWRRLSGTIDLSSLPDKWHCDMNENKSEKSCDVPQERMEADEVNYQTNTPYKRKVKEGNCLTTLYINACLHSNIGSCVMENSC